MQKETCNAQFARCGSSSHYMAEGMPWKEAITLATHAASISVTRMGAQASAPYRTELI